MPAHCEKCGLSWSKFSEIPVSHNSTGECETEIWRTTNAEAGNVWISRRKAGAGAIPDKFLIQRPGYLDDVYAPRWVFTIYAILGPDTRFFDFFEKNTNARKELEVLITLRGNALITKEAISSIINEHDPARLCK